MNRLAEISKATDSAPGTFYPMNHIVAVFRTSDDALRAKTGFERVALHDQALMFTGEEILEFAKDRVADGGVVNAMMREISRGIGTEEKYVDQDLADARKGAAFLAIHCIDEAAKAKAWAILEPMHPLAARYYTSGGIEHMAGET